MKSEQAKAVLENPAYKDAYEQCRLAILTRIEQCPWNDVESAENLRKALKLLRDVQANMAVALNTGKLEAFNIEQAQKSKANPFRGLFR